MRLRAPDTLLVERARDFLAGGPADSATVVARVCQLPGVRREMAERIAIELLAPHAEFLLAHDGRWHLAGSASAPVQHVLPLYGGAAHAPHQASSDAPAPEAPRAVPSFDEWRAAREAERADERAARHDAEREHAARPSAARERATLAFTRPAPPLALCPPDETPLRSLSYVVVDVETTGGSPQRGHRITEIAAVVVRGGAVADVYEQLVNPERGIPPEIVKLTGITMEMVRHQPAFRDVAGDVVRALEGHVFVAHNVAFDWRFVTAEVQRATGRTLEGQRLCTVRLARKLLPQLRSRSLGHVADWYGADAFAQSYFEARHGRTRPWRHAAAGDAVATAHCLLRLLDDAADRGIATWGELDRWLSGGT